MFCKDVIKVNQEGLVAWVFFRGYYNRDVFLVNKTDERTTEGVSLLPDEFRFFYWRYWIMSSRLLSHDG